MKRYKIFVDYRKEPIAQGTSEGGEMLKHQIASALLMRLDFTDYKKIKIVIEDVQED